tara:strand:+ start:182 stop:436 length:255 start_codon:yes stop_codon:yes gene_type:complete
MGRYTDRRWVIITLADYTADELENLCQNSLEGESVNIRKSIDESKAILKWDGDTPSVFNSMTTYNHTQILTILNGSDWTSDSEV